MGSKTTRSRGIAKVRTFLAFWLAPQKSIPVVLAVTWTPPVTKVDCESAYACISPGHSQRPGLSAARCQACEGYDLSGSAEDAPRRERALHVACRVEAQKLQSKGLHTLGPVGLDDHRGRRARTQNYALAERMVYRERHLGRR